LPSARVTTLQMPPHRWLVRGGVVSDVRVTKGLARLDVITDGLAQVDLFSGLSRRDLAGIARSGQAVDHRPGKEVVAEGRRGIAFHLILEGSADLGIGGRARGRLEAGD
jgi:hypothetical protein